MAVLDNPRHERFAQLVATGRNPAEAYVAAGYAGKTAYTCGPRLLKVCSVRNRVRELQQTMAHVFAGQAAVDRQFVLRELRDNALAAKQNRQYSASNRALELLGKELGMFQDRNEDWLDWDGDLSQLTDEQLQKFLSLLERMSSRQTEVIDIEPQVAQIGFEQKAQAS